jgi:hypothetical protein
MFASSSFFKDFFTASRGGTSNFFRLKTSKSASSSIIGFLIGLGLSFDLDESMKEQVLTIASFLKMNITED